MDTSTSQALVTSVGSTVTDNFIALLPTIIGVLVPVILVLWGVRKLLGLFHGGRKG